MQRGEWKEALKVMSKQQSEDAFYTHSPILMRHEPALTVGEWLKFPELEPRKLIPAMQALTSPNQPYSYPNPLSIRHKSP